MVTLVGSSKYPVLVCVHAVRYLGGLQVHLTFTDGTERDMDLGSYLHGPIFDPLREDPKLFSQVYVDPETETLTWPNGADIAPETLYYEGEPPWVKDERRVRLPRKRTTRRVAHPRVQQRKLRTKPLKQKA